jgi:hypothetical protein
MFYLIGEFFYLIGEFFYLMGEFFYLMGEFFYLTGAFFYNRLVKLKTHGVILLSHAVYFFNLFATNRRRRRERIINGEKKIRHPPAIYEFFDEECGAIDALDDDHLEVRGLQNDRRFLRVKSFLRSSSVSLHKPLTGKSRQTFPFFCVRVFRLAPNLV